MNTESKQMLRRRNNPPGLTEYETLMLRYITGFQSAASVVKALQGDAEQKWKNMPVTKEGLAVRKSLEKLNGKMPTFKDIMRLVQVSQDDVKYTGEICQPERSASATYKQNFFVRGELNFPC